MILIVILTAIFNVCLLVLLGGAVWFLHKLNLYLSALAKEQADTNAQLKDLWMYYETAGKEQADTNKKLDELIVLFRGTFSKEFKDKFEDFVKIKENIPQTVKVLCDDGKYHDLPIDRDF